MSDENRTDGGVGDVYGAGEVPQEYETEENVPDHDSTLDQILQGMFNDKLATVGTITVGLFIFVAVFAPYISPHDPGTTFDFLVGPGGSSEVIVNGETRQVWHPLGTDSFGKDMLSRIIYGARISLLVAGATAIFAFTIGTTLGVVAGYYRGVVDDVLMRFIDFLWAFPALILAIGIMAFFDGLGTLNVIVAIGIAYIDDFTRIARSEILSIREEEYITASKSVGMSDLRIMFSEILPNAVGPLLVQLTLMIPLTILAEAGLTFLGIGVSPTTPSWGRSLNEGQGYITTAWWISLFPGLAIMTTVLAFNLLGDGLRDSLNAGDEVSER
jgi:ABC-type dipeptide/oligopeptide/nickel transport system permease subunit